MKTALETSTAKLIHVTIVEAMMNGIS